MQESIEGFRLSPQQKHLWLLQQQQDSLPYWAECRITIDGLLDPERLMLALVRLQARYEILRTAIQALPGVDLPLQVIRQPDAARLQVYDLSTRDPTSQAAEIEAYAGAIRQQGFDFTSGQPLQFILATLGHGRSVLYISAPALYLDSTSLKKLACDIRDTYLAPAIEHPSDNDPLQYADFAEWQNELIESEDAEVGKGFWRQQDLADGLSLKLPYEHSRSEGKFAPEQHALPVPGDLFRACEAFANERGISLAHVLLAAWYAVLSRLTGQHDITIGVHCDGRKYDELQTTQGLFARALPAHCAVDEEHHFINLLHNVDATMRDVQQWQEYFSWDVEPAGNRNGVAFLPYAFEFADLSQACVPGAVSFRISSLSALIDRYKVTLSCACFDDALELAFHYDSNVIDLGDITCLAEYYLTLLKHAVLNPDHALSACDLMGQRERQLLLSGFNLLRQSNIPATTVHGLFEAQAMRKPDAMAVVFEDQQVTFAELDSRANRLAHYLQSLDVGPETRVAICMERSPEVLVGILGVFKAGGAYIPIAPDLPPERIAALLSRTRAPVLLTQHGMPKESWLGSVAHIVELDTGWPAIAGFPATPPGSSCLPGNLAYAIYTSGSTGIPKGVAVTHQNLCNYLQGLQERLGSTEGASFAMVSTFAADLGHSTVFAALCGGGCLHIIAQERATSSEALAAYARSCPIDILKIVPSHLAALLDSATPADIIPQRWLILGGEAASWPLIERVRALAPGCRVLNHYGPTETTVGVISYIVPAHPPAEATRTVPLGQPLLNTQIYLLDKRLRLVPTGVTGEIFVGGMGLARGYLHQPDLTAERFVPNPFLKDEGSRMKDEDSNFILHPSSLRLYKTGDLARYRPDGTIEFLGRNDHQLKIRGFRVELGEIEATLRRHAGLRETVVVAHGEQPAEPQLVAYVVRSAPDTPSLAELQQFLQTHLPMYMVPAVIVFLAALPLTANGKIDRRALPAPTRQPSTYAPPSTPIEQVLAAMWAEMLRVQQVGIHDNFFALGGHSLLATRLIARVRDVFRVELSFRGFFDAATVAGLARAIVAHEAQPGQTERIAQLMQRIASMSAQEKQSALQSMGAKQSTPEVK